MQGATANQLLDLFPATKAVAHNYGIRFLGSPGYTRPGKRPTSMRGERATYILQNFDQFSDVQESKPLPLVELEIAQMKRVLMTGDIVGGVWTFTLDLAEALDRHGVEVVLASVGNSHPRSVH